MARKRLFWRIYPWYLAVTIFSLAAVTWYSFRLMRDYALEHAKADLSARCHLIAGQVLLGMTPAGPQGVDSLSKQLGRAAAARITVILPSGQVIADSEDDPSLMENHANRPEVSEALAGRTGVATRYSQTVHQTMVYLAVPLYDGGNIVCALRMSVPLHPIGEEITDIELKLAAAGLAVAVLMAFIGLYVSRRIVRPIEEIKKGAEKFGRGELHTRLAIPDSEEMAGLATVMNEMAATLSNRVETIARQRNEQEAMLASMVEGVLAVDPEGKVLGINMPAADMLGVDRASARGRTLEEVVRNHELLSLVKESFESKGSVEKEIVFSRDTESHMRAHATTLRDASGSSIGALIVLNDITRLKKLENIRRDFVANVSHELKTPLTTIKGFVETLLGGALEHREDAVKFLKIIETQVDRLNAIIEDLLNLSRIEREAEKGEIVLDERNIHDIVQASIQTCQGQASARDIAIRLTGDENITGRVNAALLEQAVVNLIDNAVKYSEPKGEVLVDLSRSGGNLLISVKDNGCGIDKEHLPRLFERFYRIDKSRSRALGGTGLGLSIAKHIVLAHHGQISVESAPGRGSTFIITLPAA